MTLLVFYIQKRWNIPMQTLRKHRLLRIRFHAWKYEHQYHPTKQSLSRSARNIWIDLFTREKRNQPGKSSVIEAFDLTLQTIKRTAETFSKAPLRNSSWKHTADQAQSN